eukprot:612314-Hanusia_phi.AAC.2
MEGARQVVVEEMRTTMAGAQGRGRGSCGCADSTQVSQHDGGRERRDTRGYFRGGRGRGEGRA